MVVFLNVVLLYLPFQTTPQLVLLGFYNQPEPLDAENPIRGAVRDRADAIAILQDTHKVCKLMAYRVFLTSSYLIYRH